MLGLVVFEAARGTSPVTDYIEAQDAPTRARLIEAVQSFCEEFPWVVSVDVKQIRGKLWEMRVRDGSGRQHRLLYAVAGSDVLVVHAFLKKKRRAPPVEIRTAERRLRTMLPAARGRR